MTSFAKPEELAAPLVEPTTVAVTPATTEVDIKLEAAATPAEEVKELSEDEKTIISMLMYKRPHASVGDSDFVAKFIVEGLAKYSPSAVGPMRNILVIVGDLKLHPVLFSSHTDSVHAASGMQTIQYDPSFGHAFKNDGECLGADDAAGVWLMIEMIKAGVPGAYVFHRGEERGGVGSSWMASNQQEFLKQFKYAIAFDRKGVTSVITRQRGGRCCSSEFAKELAKRLSVMNPEDPWKPDDSGTFTDTANYTSLIPECTNLSVGYYDQHTKDEMLDVTFLIELRDKLINIEWNTLPVKREAKDETPSWQGGRRGYDDPWDNIYGRGYVPPRQHASATTDKYGFPKKEETPTAAVVKTAPVQKSVEMLTPTKIAAMKMSEIIAFVRENPIYAAVLLNEAYQQLARKSAVVEELSEIVFEQELQLETNKDTILDLQAVLIKNRVQAGQTKLTTVNTTERGLRSKQGNRRSDTSTKR